MAPCMDLVSLVYCLSSPSANPSYSLLLCPVMPLLFALSAAGSDLTTSVGCYACHWRIGCGGTARQGYLMLLVLKGGR
jgi:hypothetical protein